MRIWAMGERATPYSGLQLSVLRRWLRLGTVCQRASRLVINDRMSTVAQISDLETRACRRSSTLVIRSVWSSRSPRTPCKYWVYKMPGNVTDKLVASLL